MTTATPIEAIAAAVESLGAIRLPAGAYAYRADEVGQWVYGVPAGDLEKLGRKLLAGDADAYGEWAQASGGDLLEDDDARLDEIAAAGGNAKRKGPSFVSFDVIQEDGEGSPRYAVLPFGEEGEPVDHPVAGLSFRSEAEARAAAEKAIEA